MVLGSEDVQKELKITDEQKTKLKEFQDKQAAARREAFPQGQQPDQEKIAEFRKKSVEDTNKFLKDTLTDDQTKRLKQISLQNSLKMAPALAFADEDTAKALKITDDQKEKIKSISTKLQEDSRDLRPQRGQQPSEENTKKLTALRKEANEKIMEVLSDEQRKTLKDMQGEEFKGTIAPPGGRRPGAAGTGTGAGTGAGAGRGARRANPPAEEKKPEEKKPDEKKPEKKDG